MRTPQLSDEERRLLKDYKANAPHKLVIKKAEALLLLSRDVAPEIVAEFVDRGCSFDQFPTLRAGS